MTPASSANLVLTPGRRVTAIGTVEATNDGVALWVVPSWGAPHRLHGGRVDLCLDPVAGDLPDQTQLVVIEGTWTAAGGITRATLRSCRAAPTSVIARSPAARRSGLTEDEVLTALATADSLAGELGIASGAGQDHVHIQVLHLSADLQAWLAQLTTIPLEVAVSITPSGSDNR